MKKLRVVVVAALIAMAAAAFVACKVSCAGCYGTGECNFCEGTGKENGATCAACKGSGDCPMCDGKGRIKKKDNTWSNVDKNYPSSGK